MSARKHAKHAAPSSVGPALAAGSLTVAFVVADGAAAAVSSAALPSTGGRATAGVLAATADDFARLRVCESGGDYRINTGNGYYGAYQFAPATWRGLGFSGMPHEASPATQDAAARTLQASQGWKPWPGCARKLGLGSSGAHAAPRKAPGRHAAPPKASRSRVAAPRTAPVLERAISLADRRSYRLVVAQWQARMKQRGWKITVDGYFGPQSASVARRFAAEKGLRLQAAATVDRALYTAAWTAPVT